MPQTPEAMFFDNFAAVGLRRQASLLDARLAPLSTLELGVRARRAPTSTLRPEGTDTLDRLLYTDIKTYLVELLMKQDQMSMAASIESRVPFLDHHLVEFVATLAPRMKLRGLTTKWILRQAVKDILPREILTRPKMGFPVPFSIWMRGPWADVARDVLFDRRSRERGIVNHRALAQLMQAHAPAPRRPATPSGRCSIWSSGIARSWMATASRLCRRPRPRRACRPTRRSRPPPRRI